MSRRKIEIGKVPGTRLTVMEIFNEKDKAGRNRTMTRVMCECGEKRVCRSGALNDGRMKSCGCLNREQRRAGKLAFKHGMVNTTIYQKWASMIQRCENPNAPHYEYYGGRGIKVCKEWHDFKKFYEDAIELGYREGDTIERKENDGHYCFKNVKFANQFVQANNKRSNKFITLSGIRKTATQWARIVGRSPSFVLQRLRRGWSDERALFEPKNWRGSENAI